MGILLENGHLPRGVIRNYACGSHSIEDSAQIVEHLSECSECRDAFVFEMQGIFGDQTKNRPIIGESVKPAADSLDIVGYRNIEPLAKGGMGTIYSAVQEGTKRKVAIKCITEDGREPISPDRTKRALREAQALAKLSHPNIVTVIEVLTVRQLPALVMEHVSGVPLDEWIRAHRPNPIQALKIAIQLVDAVAHAHLQGVLHCDLKPQNILIQTEDDAQSRSVPFVKLIDFGLSKLQREDWRITRPGDVFGTPAYMAPEQASGGASHSTQAVDIYGLGTVLYELLTGQPVFMTQDRSTLLAQILGHSPILPSSIDPMISKDLDTLCLKCLEKSPSDRYASAAALRRDLQAVLNGDPIATRRQSTLMRWKRWGWRHPGQASTLVSLVAFAALGAYVMLYNANQNKRFQGQLFVEAENAKEARTRAEQAEESLLEELRTSLKDMSHQAFGSHPDQNSKEQKTVLAIAQRWQVFATRLGDSPKGIAVRAEAIMRLGVIDSILGDQIASAEKLNQALDILEKIDDSNQYPQCRFLIAETYHHLAISNKEQEKVDASIECCHKGIRVIEESLSSFQGEPWKRLELLARMRIDLGMLLTVSYRFEESKEQFNQIKTLLETTQPKDIDQQEYQGIATQRCRSSNKLAMLYHAQGNIREAIGILDEISDTVIRIARSAKADTESLDTYTIHQTLTAICYRDIGEFQKASEHLQNAIQVQRKLMAWFPAIPLLKSQLGNNLNLMGALEAQSGRLDHSLDASLESLQLQRELLEKYPNKESYRFEQANAIANLVAVRTALDQLSEAMKFAPELIEARRALHDSYPNRFDYKHGLAAALNVIGGLMTKCNKPEKAAQFLSEAEQLFQDLVRSLPASQLFRSGLAKAYLLRGDLAYKNGDWSQALEMYSKSIAMFQSKNNESNPTDQNWIEYCSLRQAAAIEALGDANSKPSVLEPAGSLEPR